MKANERDKQWSWIEVFRGSVKILLGKMKASRISILGGLPVSLLHNIGGTGSGLWDEVFTFGSLAILVLGLIALSALGSKKGKTRSRKTTKGGISK